MATELRHSARTAERSEPPDPSQTGARARLADSSQSELVAPALPRHGERPSSVPARRSRVTRPSIRPSAFGMPRSSSRPSPPVTSHTNPKRDSVPPGGAAGASHGDHSPPHSEMRELPRASQGAKKRAAGLVPPPVVKTDIEELLPITQGVKSLPRPPRLPGFEQAQVPPPAPRRFPWASLAVFVVMLAASFAPLSHYRGERVETPEVGAAPLLGPSLPLVEPLDQRSPRAASTATAVLRSRAEPLASTTPSTAVAVDAAPLPSTVERIERAAWGDPTRTLQALLDEGERALRANDERLAEMLFARSLDFSPAADARGAYGLARVRLAQGDLEGAEGWVSQAIQKHPRQAEFRALHAEVLQRWGRDPEAELERALARSLPHFPAETRSR